jgi:formate-dependent nitrite reductase membrane component NrfD
VGATGLASTWFTQSPDWRWLIVGYFFIGGLAGGCYFLAALLDLAGSSRDRALARLGYLAAFPAVVVCGILLTLDLGRPERFWHMLVQSNTGRPMFKPYSPMSIGAWALLVFGAFSLLSFLAALRELGWLSWRWPARLRPPGVAGALVALGGGLAGLFLSGYTGVLLAVTNRPIWADTTLLGASFVVSSASTSTALLTLLGPGWAPRAQLDRLVRFGTVLLALELAALVALVASLGPLARAWLTAWGALLVVGVVVAGILVPLILHRRPRRAAGVAVGALLVLAGGSLFRTVIVLSSEGLGIYS